MTNRGRVLAALLAIAASGVMTAHAAVKPVVTNKQRFRIPFRFDQQMLQRINARELQLFVSANRGGNWELAQSITPQSGKFEYQAPADGEYWFAVRTIDGNGLSHPPGPRFDPGLMVIVDTIPPSLAINLEQTPAGKIQLTWSANDPQLDISSLKLEYTQPGQTTAERVSVVPSARGMTAWTIPSGGRVRVIGTIADLAGNTGEASSEIDAKGTGPAKPAVPQLRQPIADGPRDDQFSEQSLPAPGPMIEPRITAAPTTEGSALRPNLQPAPPAAPVLPANTPFVSDQPQFRPDVVQERWSPPTTPAPPQPDPQVFRPNARQRIVNARRFQLGYKLDDVGPSGVGGVELFITQDQGRMWYRYGEDPDRQSPFEVTVPRDGEYGFAVRVRSGAGLGMDPPAPGEPAAIQVVVDQTPPRLELLPIQQGRGSELNQIQIRWKMTEEHPAQKPISLYYAASPVGPWEPISGWRDDGGSFAWSVGPGSPAQFYVRVMARDLAGNVAHVDSAEAIVVDLARPSARIVDVEVQPSTGPR
ncbi:hypothetical protein GC163_03410 [bacterium]|nr:hypothetical protein [bacterium]